MLHDLRSSRVATEFYYLQGGQDSLLIACQVRPMCANQTETQLHMFQKQHCTSRLSSTILVKQITFLYLTPDSTLLLGLAALRHDQISLCKSQVARTSSVDAAVLFSTASKPNPQIYCCTDLECFFNSRPKSANEGHDFESRFQSSY